ncbi:hypothetical protein CAEBREN_29098 [Caenorhabditis brenneri]|uniref:Uncharacterized protein n=1 Tax=Caenorhabditis brenneri TaxID=135651 RepID=G0P7N7_CAEBE|nr:hypothetical protein CAEBREN_29098 [Caenorhabditis brenneri]
MRRRSPDQLGTAPPLAGINSDASSSSDARQHLVQVGNHIDYTESAEGLISGMPSSGSTGSSVTSSPRGKRRRSSDRFDTASPIAASDSGTSSSPDARQYMPLGASELLENRERPGDSMLNNFSNSKKLKSGNHLSGSTENPLELIPQVGDSDDFTRNDTESESEQSIPPILDDSEENERRARRERRRELNRRNQKKHYDKIKANCKKAREEIPRLREEWKKLKEANQCQLNLLNDEQKSEIDAISKRFEKQLAKVESSVEELKMKPAKDNSQVFRKKQNLVLKQQELEELRLKKQQDISKKPYPRPKTAAGNLWKRA